MLAGPRLCRRPAAATFDLLRLAFSTAALLKNGSLPQFADQAEWFAYSA